VAQARAAASVRAPEEAGASALAERPEAELAAESGPAWEREQASEREAWASAQAALALVGRLERG
jgi:hypothetical protein